MDKITGEEFSEFRKRVLDKPNLNEKDLKAIREGLKLKDKLYADCDEAHAHEFRCLDYHREENGRYALIVARLLTEISGYIDNQEEIRKLTEKKS